MNRCRVHGNVPSRCCDADRIGPGLQADLIFSNYAQRSRSRLQQQPQSSDNFNCARLGLQRDVIGRCHLSRHCSHLDFVLRRDRNIASIRHQSNRLAHHSSRSRNACRDREAPTIRICVTVIVLELSRNAMQQQLLHSSCNLDRTGISSRARHCIIEPPPERVNCTNSNNFHLHRTVCRPRVITVNREIVERCTRRGHGTDDR